MIDLKYLRQHPEEATQRLSTRGVEPKNISELLLLDAQYRKLEAELQQYRSEKNSFSKRVASVDQAHKAKEIKKMASLDSKEKQVGQKATELSMRIDTILKSLPNLPSEDTPIGEDESSNVVIKTQGSPPTFDFAPRDYMTLADRLEMIDTRRAAKVSGSRFGYLTGAGADLWFALVQYTLDELRAKGFKLFFPPVLVRQEVMENTGYDSYLEGQEAYRVEKDGLYLVGTGEHALLPYHSNEILLVDTLPRMYAAYSSCFRREAGSYGKDTKGILRVHQFEKVEMVVISKPKDSSTQLDQLVSIQEQLVSSLRLPYHLLQVCTGDLPRPSAKVIDLECWIPSEQRYRETHSASNCTDYQARRNTIRIRMPQGSVFAHILNATAVTPRTLVAIMENNQHADGSISIPEPLRRYLGEKTMINVSS